VDLVH
jgi:hypothetical protein